MPIDDILMDAEEQMEKTIEHLRHELRTIRTGARPGARRAHQGGILRHPTDLRRSRPSASPRRRSS